MILSLRCLIRARRRPLLVAALVAGFLSAPFVAPPSSVATTCSCALDCDDDCTVTQADLDGVITAIFDTTGASACTKADSDLDGRITATDVVAVYRAIAIVPSGCTAAPTRTPTPSPTESSTHTRIPTATSSHTRTRTATPRPPTPTPSPLTTPVSRWIDLAPMPMGGAQEVGVAHLGGVIYVIGGLAPGATDRVEAYDIAANQWRSVAPLPFATHHIGAATHGGFVYAIGGLRPPGFTPTDQVFRYDPTVDRWDPVASMPSRRGAMAVAVSGDRIHVVAGDSFGAVTDHAVYLPAENRWVELAPYPAAREHIAAAAVDGVVYVVGGRSPVSSEAFRWDDDLGWVSLPRMTTRRAGHAATELAGRLVTFGGEGNPSDRNGILSRGRILRPNAEPVDAHRRHECTASRDRSRHHRQPYLRTRRRRCRRIRSRPDQRRARDRLRLTAAWPAPTTSRIELPFRQGHSTLRGSWPGTVGGTPRRSRSPERGESP